MNIALINHSSFKHSIKISLLFITMLVQNIFFMNKHVFDTREELSTLYWACTDFSPETKKNKKNVRKNTFLVMRRQRHIKTYRHGLLCTLYSLFFFVAGNGGNATAAMFCRISITIEKWKKWRKINEYVLISSWN